MCVKSQPAYDGFRHLVRSINANGDTLMPMFALYCDDSGTHRESDIAVAGCFIATVQQWDKFKKLWSQINAREHFGVFHMADFVARKGQFAEAAWQDEMKRRRVINALLTAIKRHARFAISATVIKSAYDEIMPINMRERLGMNHYTFAIRLCISLVEEWRQRFGYTTPVKYVFDRLPKGQGKITDITAAFEIAASGGDDAVKRYGIYKLGDEDGWSFDNKAQIVQLQAADIWAYESYRYAIDTFFAADKKDIRFPYQFIRENISNETRYHTRESLIELVRRTRDYDEHHE